MEILTMVGLYILALLGMFIHFLKKNVKGESWKAITTYFDNHLKSTIIAWVVTTGSAAFLWFYQNETNPITYILVGYTFDSILNKWDKEEIKIG